MSDHPHKIVEEAAPVTKLEQEKNDEALALSATTAASMVNMNVKVYSPFRDYFDGQAFSISAESMTGPFDILPRHHSFISLLRPCELVLRTVENGEQKIRISGGIMHVKANKVIVFLDV